MSKLIMECFGTFVFTMLFLSGSNPVILVGLWVLTIFCWKISASQMNPAVTLAFMFRHDSQKIHYTLGVLMMGAQCVGAYLGALYIAFVNWSIYPMEPTGSDSDTQGGNVFPAMMQEIIGTFIFVLFFKIVTDERLYFSKENAINCFIIASAYVASRSIVNGATS
jgi:glycerol uptake facilitator-like aquaporin